MRGIGLLPYKSYTSHRQKYECLFELAEFIVTIFITIPSHYLPLLRYYVCRKFRPLVATIVVVRKRNIGIILNCKIFSIKPSFLIFYP